MTTSRATTVPAEQTADVIASLGMILPGDVLERLTDLLADPDADFSPGELAHMGAAFSKLGERLTTCARSVMQGRLDQRTGGASRAVDAGVLFQYRGPSTQTRVDTDAVRKSLPAEDYPDLYKTVEVKGTVSITLLGRAGAES